MNLVLAAAAAFHNLPISAWLKLVHPVLMVLFVYPVVGATIRLGILARERRLQINPIAATVPLEHAQHGAWVTGGVLVAILISLSTSLSAWFGPLLLVATAVLFSYVRLLRARPIWQRLMWAIACWLGLLLAGLRPEVDRLSDIPWSPLFWQSHFWMGFLLTGLLLNSAALQPAIGRDPAIRRLHVVSNVLVALLLAMQAISGTRNLLVA